MANRAELEALIKLREEVSGKIATVDKRLAKLDRSVGQVNKSTQGLGSTFKTGALQAVGLGTGIGAAAIAVGKLSSAVASGVRGFVSFEKSMLRIETLVGVSRDEVEAMKDSVRGIAAETGRAPQELAEAMFQITSAGLRGNDAMIALEASARGAALGLGETSAVADAATSIVNAYGTETIDAAGAVDVLTATVRLGKASADEFASSIGTVIPIASAADVSIQEVGTAMAILTRSGASASESATQVAGLIRAIVKPSQQASQALATVGLTMDDVRESVREKGLLATMEDLRQRLDSEQLARFAGRAEALNAVLGLTGDKFDETSAAAEEMSDSFGLAEESMKRLEEDASFRAERVAAVWQNAKDNVGEAFVEIAFQTIEGAAALSDYADALDNSGQIQNQAVAGLIRLIAGFNETSEAVDKATESTSRLAEQESSLARAQANFSKTLSDLDEEIARRQEEAARRQEQSAKALEERQKKLLKVEKSRASVLGPLVKLQEENARAAEELAFQNQVLALEADRASIAFDELGNTLDTIPLGVKGVGDLGLTLQEIPPAIEGIGDEIGALPEATEEAERRQEEYNQALARAADLAAIIPGEFGQIVSQTVAAASALRDIGGGFGGIFDALGSGDFLGGLSDIAGIAGPIAGLAAPLIGGIADLFGGRGVGDVVEEASRDLGARVSEQLAESILDSGRPVQLAIADIFEAGGFDSVDRFAQEIGDAFSFFERGEISQPELIGVLQESIPLLIENFDQLGARGEEEVQRILSAAERLGIEFEGLGELIQTQFATDTVEDMAEAFGLTNQEVRALAEELGVNVQTNLERAAAAAGVSVETFNQLAEAIGERLGKDGAASIEELQQFLDAMGVSAAEAAEALGLAVSGEGSEGAAEEAAQTEERLGGAADQASRLADELTRAAGAARGINVGGLPGGGVPTTPAQTGFHGDVTGPRMFFVEPGARERVDITPESAATGAGPARGVTIQKVDLVLAPQGNIVQTDEQLAALLEPAATRLILDSPSIQKRIEDIANRS